MKWIYPIALLFVTGTVHAETVNLVCTHIIDGKPYSSALTIMAPKPGVKGKVFVDDISLDRKSEKSSQVIKNVMFSPSFISYEVHFETYSFLPNGVREISGSVESEVKISRVTGKRSSTSYGKGKISTFDIPPVDIFESQCEPRKANKF